MPACAGPWEFNGDQDRHNQCLKPEDLCGRVLRCHGCCKGEVMGVAIRRSEGWRSGKVFLGKEVLKIQTLAFGGKSLCQGQLRPGNHPCSGLWSRTREHYGRSASSLDEVPQVLRNSVME